MALRSSLPWLWVLLVACSSGNERAPILPDDPYSNVQLTLVAPARGAIVSGMVDFEAEVIGNTRVPVEFFVDGLSVGQVERRPFLLKWDSSSVPEGIHFVEVRQEDRSDSSSFTVWTGRQRPDALPSVQLVSPKPNAMVCGQLPVEVSARDDVGIAKVEFFVGQQLLGQRQEQPYYVDWNTRSTPNGDYLIRAIATDTAGQQVQAAARVTVNNVGGSCDNPPSVVISGRRDLFLWAGSQRVTFEATARDDVGISKVQFFVDQTLIAEVTTPPYRATWNPNSVSDESVLMLKVVAIDTANQTNFDQAPLMVDRTPPLVSLVSPPDGTAVPTNAVTLVADASDNGVLDRVEFQVDDFTAGADSTAPFSVTVSSLWPGEHRWRAVAVDKAGNTASTGFASFRSSLGPTISFIAPTAGATVSGSVELRAKAAAPAGVRDVSFTSSAFGTVVASYDRQNDTWFAKVETCSAANGSIAIRADVTDFAGGTGYAELAVTLRNVGGAPVLSGSQLGAGTVSLSWVLCPPASKYKVFWARSPGVTYASTGEEVLSSPYSKTFGGTASIYFRVATYENGVFGPLSNEVMVNVGSAFCSSRCDCPGAGEVCTAGKCMPAAAAGSCVRDDHCPLGSICDFNHKCVPGCAADCDCSNSTICNTSTLQCEACSRTNPCPNGLSCSANGECVPVLQCTSTSQCPGGQVCRMGVCGFCASNADCAAYGTGFLCGGRGLCESVPVCSDASCQAALGTPRAYCNALNLCDVYECLSDADCVAPTTCDLASKSCNRGPQCDFQTCESTCQSRGEACAGSSCSCVPLEHAPSFAVLPDGSPCDLFSCLLGVCVDSADVTRVCAPDPVSCQFGSVFGVMVCN